METPSPSAPPIVGHVGANLVNYRLWKTVCRASPKRRRVEGLLRETSTPDPARRPRPEGGLSGAQTGSRGPRAEERRLPPGDTLIEAALQVDSPRLWELNDPFLYRVTARVRAAGSCSLDEHSTRCGFRDFRFEKGYFRLNGRRIFLRGAHTVNATPVGQQVPGDPGLFQRDLLYMKTMGMNCIRFIWGGATRRQLDLCDEMGLLVYDEHAAANPMQVSPQMEERFDRSVAETIRAAIRGSGCGISSIVPGRSARIASHPSSMT